MSVQDIGNIYYRRHEETFFSHVFTWKEISREDRIEVKATTPVGSYLGLFVRSGADTTTIASAIWRKVTLESFKIPTGDCSLQYRLHLVSANVDAYPLVRKVKVPLR